MNQISKGAKPAAPKKAKGAKRTSSPQKRGAATKAKILKAATKLFADHGYEGVSVDQVAKAADVRFSLIAYHFGSKEELWQAVVDDIYSQVDTIIGKDFDKLKTLPPRDALRLFLTNYVEALYSVPAYPRINVLEGALDTSRSRYLRDQHVGRHHKDARSTIFRDDIIALLPDIDTRMLFLLIIGAAQIPYVLTQEISEGYGFDFSKKAMIKPHVDNLMILLTGEK